MLKMKIVKNVQIHCHKYDGCIGAIIAFFVKQIAKKIEFLLTQCSTDLYTII